MLARRHKIVLSVFDTTAIHSAPYRANLEQKELEREEAVQTEKAGVAEHTVTVWKEPIVFVPKRMKALVFASTVAERMKV